jgi:hypothetical protein
MECRLRRQGATHFTCFTRAKKVQILTLRAASQVHNLWQAWGLFEAKQLNFDDARKYLVRCRPSRLF